jgi:hypothetical protein
MQRKYWEGSFVAALFLLLLSASPGIAQDQQEIDDISATYHFLSADDSLGILDQEGKLKGYIEVAQTADESDDLLSYQIISGTREKNRVQFKTNSIHRRYYRFTGKVERGSGITPNDPDYLHLMGALETVTIKGDDGKEVVDRKYLVFKSIGKSETDEDEE